MATKPRARKTPAAKPSAAKPRTEASEESSNVSSRWQQARERGMNFGSYLQNEKQAAARTPSGAPTEAVTESANVSGSYRRGRIWA